MPDSSKQSGPIDCGINFATWRTPRIDLFDEIDPEIDSPL